MNSLRARDHGLTLHSENDALDILSSGLSGCILYPEDLHPEFFDLSNQMAGGILQKFVNYNFRVALIIPSEHSFGERVTELIRDHRSHPCVRFFADEVAAQKWLSTAD